MDLDLKQLLHIARRWWWLLILLPIVAGGSAWYSANNQTPMYSATATIRVNAPAGSALDSNALRASQDLTETYRQLIVLAPVLDAVIESLDLPVTASALADHVTASKVADTQLIRISVTDPDPGQAATIANTVASSFAMYTAKETLSQIDATRASLDEQIAQIQAEVDALDAEIASLEIAINLGNAAGTSDIEGLRGQRSRLQQQITDLEVEGQAVGLGIAAAQTQVTISAPAVAPKEPYVPTPRRSALLGIFVGALLAAGLIALLEYLDNTVKSDSNIEELTGRPVLASVNSVPKLAPGGQQVFVISKPRSPAAESIRLLRANLEFAFAGTSAQTLIVSSAGPGEGKSTITANLAVASAQAGIRTLLIDADLRKPTQHRIFSVPNERGLSTLLAHPDRSLEELVVRVAVPHLSLLPSGPIPPNPADLLSLGSVDELLAHARDHYDLILLDTPPIRAVSDPIITARHTDGVLLLTRVGNTKRDSLNRSVDALQQAGIRLVGVVLNQVTDSDGSGYYYYYESGSKESPPAAPQPARDA